MTPNIWDEILACIKPKVNRHSFSTWFGPTAFVADDGSSITVRVPSPLLGSWLSERYSVVLAEALAEVHREGTSIVFVAEDVSDRSVERTP